jgi:hypothetical protein
MAATCRSSVSALRQRSLARFGGWGFEFSSPSGVEAGRACSVRGLCDSLGSGSILGFGRVQGQHHQRLTPRLRLRTETLFPW